MTCSTKYVYTSVLRPEEICMCTWLYKETLFIISLKKDLCNVLVIDLNASYILKVYQLTHALVKISSRGLLEGLNHRFLLLWFLNSGRFLYLQLENPLRTCFQVSIIILLDCVYWCIGMNNDVFKQIKSILMYIGMGEYVSLCTLFLCLM